MTKSLNSVLFWIQTHYPFRSASCILIKVRLRGRISHTNKTDAIFSLCENRGTDPYECQTAQRERETQTKRFQSSVFLPLSSRETRGELYPAPAPPPDAATNGPSDDDSPLMSSGPHPELNNLVCSKTGSLSESIFVSLNNTRFIRKAGMMLNSLWV